MQSVTECSSLPSANPSLCKTKDEVIEADNCVCATALATVKDREAELQQLMTEWEKLR